MAHKRGCMNSYKVDYEQSPCKAFKGPFHSFGFTHQPHEHVILFFHINHDISIERSVSANRFVVSIFAKLLHSRKAFLNHGSDEFHFLSDLRRKVR